MEIRGLTPEQIERAVSRASEKYNGNITLVERHVRAKRAPEDVEVREHSYTVRAGWRVFYMDANEGGSALPEEWTDYGFEPYVPTRSLSGEVLQATEEERLGEEKRQCQEKVEELRAMEQRFGGMFGAPSYYEVRFVPEHVRTFTTTIREDYTTTKYEDVSGPRTPNRYRIQLRVVSARRPGARVSQRGDYRTGKRKRIGSACWHAHRDVFRAMFEENEDAEIRTGLANYKGSDHFERSFERTAYGQGHAGAAIVSDIGDACNCDEGDYPEYAIEGLTEEQYEMRLDYWGDSAEKRIPAPKRKKAIIREEDAA